MTPGRDDEALSWGGDDDPTLDVGVGRAKDPGPEGTTGAAEPVAAAPVGLPEGFEAVGKGSHDVARLDADGTVAPDPAAAPLGNAMFVALGVFGGAYLLYAIGWVVGGMRLQGRLEYLVSDVMFQGSFWLAVLAPVLWFATVFLLTIRSAAWVRIAWLVGGALLLVPWPFILTGAVGR
ncbi:DNA polymerase III subunit gamma/tau [Microbacterium ulmi]|uniref:DNA polymerase III subunit gamma/tau n=1 Tax=Microbacterium ulmi TaxID=179095 RepID=A0A7Y2Q077_9MICO|nr:DNA polymerase III subunit gamma/tau [Microbacterium ulmi]